MNLSREELLRGILIFCFVKMEELNSSMEYIEHRKGGGN